jgi:hypothetical protein
MSLIRVSESDNWVVDYNTERGMYYVSYFEDGHFVDQHRFDCYEEKEIRLPACSVGDEVWYQGAGKDLVKCRISMLQQKADKSWKVRLTHPHKWVFDITMDEFNKYCFYDMEEVMSM